MYWLIERMEGDRWVVMEGHKSRPEAVASYERMVSGHPGWVWRLVEVQAEHKGTK